MLSNRSQPKTSQDTLKQQIAQQQTNPYPSILSTPHAILTTPITTIDDQELMTTNESKKKIGTRIAGTIVVGVIALILYFVWQPAAPAPQAAVTTQYTAGAAMTSKLPTPAPTDTTGSTGGNIQVYIIGAVQHPGVYTLTSNARVYQLLQAAGGALSTANLAVINMAARLSDGQEIYLPHIGETPIPAMSGATNSTAISTTSSTDPTGLVNINSASTDQLRQSLHLSSKSAQDIVTYRLQHGTFSSVDALAQVLSKAVYNKIKDKVTI